MANLVPPDGGDNQIEQCYRFLVLPNGGENYSMQVDTYAEMRTHQLVAHNYPVSGRPASAFILILFPISARQVQE